MANLKITVSLPEDLAIRFVRAVPSAHRSRYVADLISAKLAERERMLIEACEAAAGDLETLMVEQDMAGLPNPMTEEWNGCPELSAAR